MLHDGRHQGVCPRRSQGRWWLRPDRGDRPRRYACCPSGRREPVSQRARYVGKRPRSGPPGRRRRGRLPMRRTAPGRVSADRRGRRGGRSSRGPARLHQRGSRAANGDMMPPFRPFPDVFPFAGSNSAPRHRGGESAAGVATTALPVGRAPRPLRCRCDDHLQSARVLPCLFSSLPGRRRPVHEPAARLPAGLLSRCRCACHLDVDGPAALPADGLSPGLSPVSASRKGRGEDRSELPREERDHG